MPVFCVHSQTHPRAHELAHTHWEAQTVLGSGGNSAVHKEGDQSVLLLDSENDCVTGLLIEKHTLLQQLKAN